MHMCEWKRLRFLSSGAQSCLSIVCISALVQPPPSSFALSLAYVDPVTSLTVLLLWLLRAWGRAGFSVFLCGLCFVQRCLDPEMSPWLHRVVFIVLPIEKKTNIQVRKMWGVCMLCMLATCSGCNMNTLFRMNRWFILKYMNTDVNRRCTIWAFYRKISRKFHRAPD